SFLSRLGALADVGSAKQLNLLRRRWWRTLDLHVSDMRPELEHAPVPRVENGRVGRYVRRRDHDDIVGALRHAPLVAALLAMDGLPEAEALQAQLARLAGRGVDLGCAVRHAGVHLDDFNSTSPRPQ